MRARAPLLSEAVGPASDFQSQLKTREIWDGKRQKDPPNGNWSLTVRNKLLPKPLYRTFDDEAQANEYGAQLETLLAAGIHRKLSVVQQADAGTPYAIAPFWLEVANSREFTIPVRSDPWKLPSGAFGESCGPS